MANLTQALIYIATIGTINPGLLYLGASIVATGSVEGIPERGEAFRLLAYVVGKDLADEFRIPLFQWG